MLRPFPAAAGDERFCLHSVSWCQCRRGYSHCPPSSVGSARSRFWHDVEKKHRARSTPRHMPRAAAESPSTRNGSGEPEFCEKLQQKETARVAAYNSPSPQEKERTPCVALVSSAFCPSLITSPELLLRSVFFAAQSPSAYASLGMTIRDAVRARGTVPVYV